MAIVGEKEKPAGKEVANMNNTFKHLAQKDLEEGKRFLTMYSGLSEMERMQVMIYASALSDRSKIAQDIERDKEVKAG